MILSSLAHFKLNTFVSEHRLNMTNNTPQTCLNNNILKQCAFLIEID